MQELNRYEPQRRARQLQKAVSVTTAAPERDPAARSGQRPFPAPGRSGGVVTGSPSCVPLELHCLAGCRVPRCVGSLLDPRSFASCRCQNAPSGRHLYTCTPPTAPLSACRCPPPRQAEQQTTSQLATAAMQSFVCSSSCSSGSSSSQVTRPCHSSSTTSSSRGITRAACHGARRQRSTSAIVARAAKLNAMDLMSGEDFYSILGVVSRRLRAGAHTQPTPSPVRTTGIVDSLDPPPSPPQPHPTHSTPRRGRVRSSRPTTT